MNRASSLIAHFTVGLVLCCGVVAIGGDHPDVGLEVDADAGDWSTVPPGKSSQIGSVHELTILEEQLVVDPPYRLIKVQGEIRNDHDVIVGSITLHVAALDDEGQLLGAVRTSLPADLSEYPWTSPFQIMVPGATNVFAVGLSGDPDEVATVLVRAEGVEVSFEPGGLELELVGEWVPEFYGTSIQLNGRIRNPHIEDVVGIEVRIIARTPSGAILGVGRTYPYGELIGGYLGGLRPGEEMEVRLGLGIDPADFDDATLETRVVGREYGGGWFRYGIAGVARTAGVNGSVWRSSLTLTNRSGAAAGVNLRYFHSAGSADAALELADAETLHYDDVVRALFGISGSSAGYVQIASSAPLIIVGRTSNETPDGGFGQNLPVYTPKMTLDFMSGGVLTGLRGAGTFRTNVGLVNMGDFDCTCRVELYDRDGLLVLERPAVQVDATSWRQLNDIVPPGIDVAYANVDPESCLMWSYASVIENSSGDPTTVGVELPIEINLAPYNYASGGWAPGFGSWFDLPVPQPPQP